MPTYYNCAPTHRSMYEFNAQPIGMVVGSFASKVVQALRFGFAASTTFEAKRVLG